MTQWRPRSIPTHPAALPQRLLPCSPTAHFGEPTSNRWDVVWERQKKKRHQRFRFVLQLQARVKPRSRQPGRHSIERSLSHSASLTEPCEGNQRRRRRANDVAKTCFCYCCATTVTILSILLYFKSIKAHIYILFRFLCHTKTARQTDKRSTICAQWIFWLVSPDLSGFEEEGDEEKDEEDRETPNTNRIQFLYIPSA